MPRKRRAWSPDLFYHVVMRGNNRQVIFQHAEDYAEFFRSLYYTYNRYPFEIVAYCIMNNHYHLLIRSPNESLSKVMGTLNKRYSDYFKRKYHYCGHLYESRYFAEATMDAKGILAASRYIHRNPIATKKPMVERMEHYSYSSYYLYKTNQPHNIPYMITTFLPSCMPVYSKQTIEDYCLFCEQDEKEMND
ncbi:transposase [Rummeliibacillus suwonensis]|uniref:transposase n=1 Tax=Rummeliibacillus suwonensis TaxID=1306154 RepID=UPI0011B4BC65|nr:transposase [Rummeliibacillus suwonensis]